MYVETIQLHLWPHADVLLLLQGERPKETMVRLSCTGLGNLELTLSAHDEDMDEETTRLVSEIDIDIGNIPMRIFRQVLEYFYTGTSLVQVKSSLSNSPLPTGKERWS